MEQKNKYGLDRSIPLPVKRAVRQDCGFGCVICGLGIYEYEHVDPEFHEAKEHDPTKITLLCCQCHGKVTRKYWSKERVKAAMLDPFCKRKGFSHEFFDVGNGHPFLRFGGVMLTNCPTPIEVDGKPLFKIEKPEEVGAPFRFSGTFCDSKGKLSLEIIENEWKAYSSNWDVEVTGTSMVIRERGRLIHLKLDVVPPDGLIVDRLNMNLNGLKFNANGDFLEVIFRNGDKSIFTSCLTNNCSVGLAFN
ncbi:hypothetical protein GCM10028819_33320 [Spirosoma humi]